jgi:hypothetical protein
MADARRPESLPVRIAAHRVRGRRRSPGARWAKRTQLGLAVAIAFHVALLSFGWGFYAWSIPMIGALGLLLRAERHPNHAPAYEVVTCHGCVTPQRRRPPSQPALWSPTDQAAVDLYWIPLGAGGHSVRFNGIVDEAISSPIQRRPRCDFYHTALKIRLSARSYAVDAADAGPLPPGR